MVIIVDSSQQHLSSSLSKQHINEIQKKKAQYVNFLKAAVPFSLKFNLDYVHVMDTITSVQI